MDKRYQIGFYYYYDKSWLGGLYYAQNLIMALNTLVDEKKPLINVYCYDLKSFEDLRSKTGYPYLKMTIIKISKWKELLRLALLPISRTLAYNIDLFKIDPDDRMVFPYGWGKMKEKLVYWLPDLQYKHYPSYFSMFDLYKKDLAINAVCKRNIPIVFSSFDSQSDFKRFYPKQASHTTYVLHFAVNQPDYSAVAIDDVKSKYGVEGNYLFCANQFWQHKNHLLLFKAFKIAVDRGMKMQLVCTGRLEDNRNPEYITKVKNYIVSNGLQDNIKLLGIIDKDEMLCLMKNSYAVVQPSLFEGWNTTVEDCKKMNKFIFLSDLPVHREQIKENVYFFNPHEVHELADCILKVKPIIVEYDYQKNVEEFANGFYSVIQTFLSGNE